MKLVHILDRIVMAKKRRLHGLSNEYRQQIAKEREKILKQRTKSSGGFKKAMKKPGLSIIGEIKKASPSRGILREEFDPIQIAKVYDQCVDAISILTEQDYFLGRVDYFREVRKVTSKPLLMKDFIFTKFQLDEAFVLGADCVLLIVAMLSEEQLRELYLYSKELGLDVLMETHTKEEVEIAKVVGADIIGINNRNLKTFATDVSTTLELASLIPEEALLISESGFHGAQDVKRLAGSKVEGILVGESFMKSDDLKQQGEVLRHGHDRS